MSEETLRVVSAPMIEVGEVKVYFAGTREECYAYMRRRGGRYPARKFQLMYESGRLSSWRL